MSGRGLVEFVAPKSPTSRIIPLVFTLRCTQKLLRRLPDKPVPEPPTPTTVLGNWYANVMTLARRPFVLAVSERTFLPVVLPLAPGRTLLPRVREQIGEVLVRMSIGQEAFETEMEAMQAWAVASARTRGWASREEESPRSLERVDMNSDVGHVGPWSRAVGIDQARPGPRGRYVAGRDHRAAAVGGCCHEMRDTSVSGHGEHLALLARGMVPVPGPQAGGRV